VYICICNALTDRRLKDAIVQTNGKCPDDVYAACGCRAKCGKCVDVIRRLLQEHAAAPAPLLAGE
jgi:bacterioferritin-associated ferredoxin